MGKAKELVEKYKVEERFDFKHFARFSAAGNDFFNRVEKYIKENPKGVASTIDDQVSQLRDDFREVEDKAETLAKALR